jgi:dipeptidyl aminopeptidase/acylaminoacyl peptidase
MMLALVMASAAQAAEPQAVGLEDFFTVKTASDPQISPDARFVAYVLSEPDLASDRHRSSLRLVSTRDGRDVPVGEGNESQPAWSADGQWLAYVRPVQGGFQIVRFRPGDGRREAGAPIKTFPSDLLWSPDGSRLAYLTAEPAAVREALQSSPPAGAKWAGPAYVATEAGFQTVQSMLPAPVEYHAYVVEASPEATPRRLNTRPLGRALPYVGASLGWSQDGQRLLASLALREEHWKYLMESSIYSISVATGEIREVAAAARTSHRPAIAKDGRFAFLCMSLGEGSYFDSGLCVGPGEQGPFERIQQGFDRPFSSVSWTSRGDLIVGLQDQGIGQIGRIDAKGRRTILATTGGGDASSYTGIGAPSVALDGTVAFAYSDWQTPSEIAIVKEGSKPRVLTSINARYLASRIVNPVEDLWTESTDKLWRIHSFVVKPAAMDSGKRYPLIVLLHGGQSSDFGPDFDLIPQVFAAHGYVVAMPNYRGSGSYGRALGDQQHYPKGIETDVLGVVDALVAKGVVDPERLYITGGSGGGMITGWTTGKTSRFRAAAMWYPPTEWQTYVLEAATGPTSLKGGFDRMPWESVAEYYERSPLSYVGSIRTPTLVTVGEKDRITPVSQSIAYFTALRYVGVPSELLVFPDEPHGIRAHPSHQLSHLAETLGWFARYGGEPLRPAAFAR